MAFQILYIKIEGVEFISPMKNEVFVENGSYWWDCSTSSNENSWYWWECFLNWLILTSCINFTYGPRISGIFPTSNTSNNAWINGASHHLLISFHIFTCFFYLLSYLTSSCCTILPTQPTYHFNTYGTYDQPRQTYSEKSYDVRD